MARILHIEDDATNRLLVRKLLAAQGFEVIDAIDGLEGIRLACARRPDLILVDINIPHLDGYEVTLRLRGEPSLVGVPIVAITAEGDRDTSLAVGCDGFLQKPIDARTFARTIAGYLGGHRELQRPDASGEHLRQQSQRIVAHLEEKIAELSAANARLVELDRARTTFYRNISHELATPMTPIVGYVKMLLDGELGPTTRAQDKALRSMDDCVRRLRGVIDNLLDVTGLETGKMRFVLRDYDLNELVRRQLDAIGPAVEARKQILTRELPPGPLPAHGDAERLGRALAQLLDNAVKFTPDEGRIGVGLRVAPGDRHEIVVADSGPGVPPEQSSRIFEPFFQVDGSPTRLHGGVGVGLAIARRIVQGFQGEIQLQEPGQRIGGVVFEGAIFSMRIARRAAG
ncbi:MAG: hybrid sensor histidine kinase/response regulator [Polyangiaceae bacterium]|jgi:signal transduction histidine kinase|nr:hybrid sensor histidine kinase/response regulator [Polyangiaceae bacterium]